MRLASPLPVEVTGSADETPVVLLAATRQPAGGYDTLCRRLHTAALRTVVIGADPRLTPKAVIGILDALDIGCGVLVGDRDGADVAWPLAAARPDRFTALVSVDRGHPRVPDATGIIRDATCPAVEINTTVLVGSRATTAVADATRRYAYGEYRVVAAFGRRSAQDVTAQLAMEIVLRASTW